jgi:hypothetical protein
MSRTFVNTLSEYCPSVERLSDWCSKKDLNFYCIVFETIASTVGLLEHAKDAALLNQRGFLVLAASLCLLV